MQNQKKRICVIGAGPRGLVAARHLSQSDQNEVVVFEAKNEVGGLWLYEHEKTELNPKADEIKKGCNFYQLYNCFHGSIQEDLVTNLPKSFMELKDFSMKNVGGDKWPCFISRANYHQYLLGYAKNFNLYDYIRFETLVKSIRLTENLTEEDEAFAKADKSRKFTVTSVNAHGGKLDEDKKIEGFDYIIVSSGQYYGPYIPKFEGAETFKGKQMHSKDFRDPKAEQFKNKKILIIGGSFSQHDLLAMFFGSRDRVDYFDKIIVACRKTSNIAGSKDFESYIKEGKLSFHTGSVKNFKENSAVFTDDKEDDIDVVIYATGYKLHIPYFNYEKDKIIDYDHEANRGQYFGPLFKKLISVRHPEVFFIGFNEQALLTHIISELQCIIASDLISGKLKYPSEEEMMKSYQIEADNHMKHCGDLSKFFRVNLYLVMPEFKECNEELELQFLRKWALEAHPEKDNEKSTQFYHIIMEAKKGFGFELIQGNFVTFKKKDFQLEIEKTFSNTMDFF